MILNFFTRIIDQNTNANYDLEQTFFNITHFQESPLETVFYFQKPDGTINSLRFEKNNGNHHTMNLLNDNFKPLRQFDLGQLSFNNFNFAQDDSNESDEENNTNTNMEQNIIRTPESIESPEQTFQ